MPSGREHRRKTADFLGYDIPEVHALMDGASRYLGGRHRVVGHNLKRMELVAEFYGVLGRRVFVCHLLQDAKILD